MTSMLPLRNEFNSALIRDRLAAAQENPSHPMPIQGVFREASVLIPLIHAEGEWRLLFIRRTETVHDHKGQVAFPGGGKEPGDGSPEATALREAQEEIGLPPEKCQILGQMPAYATVTNYLITPVVSIVNWPFPLVLSADEVARVFTVPLVWLIDKTHWEERPRQFPDGRSEPVIYFRLYDGELLWGVTARIVLNFLEICKLVARPT